MNLVGLSTMVLVAVLISVADGTMQQSPEDTEKNPKKLTCWYKLYNGTHAVPNECDGQSDICFLLTITYYEGKVRNQVSSQHCNHVIPPKEKVAHCEAMKAVVAQATKATFRMCRLIECHRDLCNVPSGGEMRAADIIVLIFSIVFGICFLVLMLIVLALWLMNRKPAPEEEENENESNVNRNQNNRSRNNNNGNAYGSSKDNNGLRLIRSAFDVIGAVGSRVGETVRGVNSKGNSVRGAGSNASAAGDTGVKSGKDGASGAKNEEGKNANEDREERRRRKRKARKYGVATPATPPPTSMDPEEGESSSGIGSP